MEWTELMLTELCQRWAAGEKASQIGSAIGVSKNAVVGKAHRLYLPARPSPISNPLSKDTRDDIDRRLQGGEAPREIAAALGISNRYVGQRADKVLQQGPIAKLGAVASHSPRSEAKPAAVSVALRIDVAAAKKFEVPPSSIAAKRVEPSPQAPRPAPAATAIGSSQGCCWPMWGFRENPTHVYCDAPRSDPAKPYCAKHCADAFVKINRPAAA